MKKRCFVYLLLRAFVCSVRSSAQLHLAVADLCFIPFLVSESGCVQYPYSRLSFSACWLKATIYFLKQQISERREIGKNVRSAQNKRGVKKNFTKDRFGVNYVEEPWHI